MSKDNTLINLAALGYVADGPIGTVAGLAIIVCAPPIIAWAVCYKLPQFLYKRYRGPVGTAAYRLMGLSPKTTERIRKLERMKKIQYKAL